MSVGWPQPPTRQAVHRLLRRAGSPPEQEKAHPRWNRKACNSDLRVHLYATFWSKASQVVLRGKEPTRQCRRYKRGEFAPWVGKIRCSTRQYSCLENPMDRGAWQVQSTGSQRVRRDRGIWHARANQWVKSRSCHVYTRALHACSCMCTRLCPTCLQMKCLKKAPDSTPWPRSAEMRLRYWAEAGVLRWASKSALVLTPEPGHETWFEQRVFAASFLLIPTVSTRPHDPAARHSGKCGPYSRSPWTQLNTKVLYF